jgi:nucleoside-diphosphate-sugar epimerase
MTVLITGGSGFVGRALSTRMLREAWQCRFAVRRRTFRDSDEVVVGDLAAPVDWAAALKGVDTVVHLAALAHVTSREARRGDTFARVNVDASRALARAAVAAGTRRFIFLSSAKVMGDASGDTPFREDDTPHPKGAYAVSKWLAEQEILNIAHGTGLATTIIRSPLVYGPGVRANFLMLLRAIDRGIPMPIGAIRNARSIVYVENLVDAIVACIRDTSAAAEVFFVKDEEDVSTVELVRTLASALKRRTRILAVPAPVLRAGLALLGRRDVFVRFAETFVVDSSRINARLGWRPPVPTAAALEGTASWYRSVAPL